MQTPSCDDDEDNCCNLIIVRRCSLHKETKHLRLPRLVIVVFSCANQYNVTQQGVRVLFTDILQYIANVQTNIQTFCSLQQLEVVMTAVESGADVTVHAEALIQSLLTFLCSESTVLYFDVFHLVMWLNWI